MYYRNAAAAIVVYDITNEATFEVLQEWITELNRLGPANIVLAIAGNKCDLEETREVSEWGMLSLSLSLSLSHTHTHTVRVHNYPNNTQFVHAVFAMSSHIQTISCCY